MLISHYSPNLFMNKFEAHAKCHRFIHDHCNPKVNLIYCGSASRLHKAIKAKEQFKKPIICWVWDIPYNWRKWCRTNDEIRQHQHRDNKIKGVISNLKKCDKVISASKYTQRILKEKFGIKSEQIYFYVDTEGFDKFESNKERDHIIQISRLVLNKRFDLTIRASQGLNKRLVLIGTGNQTPLKELAINMGVQAEFYHNIPRLELIRLLKKAEILVSPSVHEGWGLTPMEAIFCGVPILLNDLEVFREIYGNNALYHQQDNVENMRKRMGVLLDNKDLQDQIVSNCLPLIKDFTIPKFVERWKEAIKL